MSARRKQDALLRQLRGEDLERLSRQLGVTAAELSGWREAFLTAGEASLKSWPADARDAEIGRFKEKVGDLTMANELLEAKIERLEKRYFGTTEVEAMSRRVSPFTDQAYGLQRVTRIWGVSRATVYRHRHQPEAIERRRPGPLGAMADEELVRAIRQLLQDSPFHGEGYRKLWARLRLAGIRTSRRRILRLMREHGLLAHQRAGRPRGSRAHDGTITTERVDLMWGTDLTSVVTGEGQTGGVHHGRSDLPPVEILWGTRRGAGTIVAGSNRRSAPMPQPNDLSRSRVAFDQESTLVAVIEMSQSSWLVAGVVPGLERHPAKKLEVDEAALLRILHRWRDEAARSGRPTRRIVVAFEAGRDGFWLARWLRDRGVEAYVIHPVSVAVSREHRRAKTDRLDTELLKRTFLGWLRGEPDHCSMAAIPTGAEEDAKRPTRERENLVGERTRIVNRMKAALTRIGIRSFNPKLRKAREGLAGLRTPEGTPILPNTLAELQRDMARLCVVTAQIKEIEAARLERLEEAPEQGSHAMVRLLARIVGVGIETADMLVHEVLSRQLRDRRAVARYAGLTGAPDESGKRRREKGLAKAGNARVRRGMIQLAWRFLLFQKDSALTRWYRVRTADARGATRKTMIVALARKLLIVLWRFVTTGEPPEGVALRPAA